MAEHSVLMVILRTSIIFFYTYVVLRLSGRHQLAQLTLFDFLVVISLGSAVGDAMIYSEDVIPLAYSMVAIAVVAIIHILAVKLAERWYELRVLLYGKPRLVIEHGRIIKKHLVHEDLTLDQLKSMLREQGLDEVKQVKHAYIEPDGRLSVVKGKH